MVGTVEDPSTGVKFPRKQSFWTGDVLASMGAGPRIFKLAFVKVKVYAVSLYIDERAAQSGLAPIRDAPDSQLFSSLLSSEMAKAIVIHFVRGVSGKEFVEHFDKALKPRMTGDEAVLDTFRSFFQQRHLDKDTEVAMLWLPGGSLEVAVCPPGRPSGSCGEGPADMRVPSAKLAHGVFDVYTGPDSPTPEAKKAWAAGLRTLLGSAVTERES